MTEKKDHYLIVGLGKTGLSCARFLAKKGFSFSAVDTRLAPPCLAEFKTEFPAVSFELGDFKSAAFKDATHMLVSPGVSIHEPCITEAAHRGAEILGDVELFARVVNAPVVAITGSNGKSTVTTWVGAMAREAGVHVKVGGNLGTPVLDLWDEDAELYVLELSSFQLETTYSLKPKVATVLNISPDHMDRYPTLQDYITAKQRIYHDAETVILNRDDASSYTATQLQQHPTFFTLRTPQVNEWGLQQVKGHTFLAYGTELILETTALRVKGRHNQANALASLAIGTALGLSRASMIDTLKTFTGLPHRCQWVAESHGVAWYNDSKGTNVGATLAAIEGLGAELQGKIILLAGGIGKEADFTVLAEAVRKYVRTVIVFGQDGPLIKAALIPVVPIQEAEGFQDAILQARAIAQPSDAVLLSPACASYDLFNNFEHRGEVFMTSVRELLQ